MPKLNLGSLILGVLVRAPEWVRVDLASKDASTRQRAEETLAAMIAAAVQADPTSQTAASLDVSSSN